MKHATLDELWERILADPEDTPVRLLYAQACEQQGDIERAEFIRLQVAYRDQLRGDCVDHDATYRMDALQEEHGEHWARPIASRVPWYDYYAGFVERIKLDATTFLAQAADLYRLAPIRRLILVNAAPVIDELARSPHLARIVTLALSTQDLGDDAIATLAASPHVSRLAWLDVGGNDITMNGVEAMVASSNFSSLRYVEFFDNPVAPAVREQNVGSDQGQIISWGPGGLLEVEQRHGRRTWLHAIEDHGYREVRETEF